MDNEPVDLSAEQKDSIEAFKARRPIFIQAYLASAGIAKHELTATWDRVPEEIRKILLEKEGWAFGLMGGYGVGKTFSIIAGIARKAGTVIDEVMSKEIESRIYQSLRYNLPFSFFENRLPIDPWPLWCNWPGEVTTRRGQLYRDKDGVVEDWILDLQDPGRLVILDDLGADRATGQDWAGEVLARVIDERLRQEAPTVWTSNLNPKELTERYGARTFSRLQELAPLIRLPDLPDQRLRKKSSPGGGNC